MDAPSKKPKNRRNGGKGRQLIRSFFTFVIVFALIGLSIFNYLQVVQLKQANSQLTAANIVLKHELVRRRAGRPVEQRNRPPIVVPINPVIDAQVHLGKAETALTNGNVGVAVDECKLATAEIQTASSSTSSTVRASVGNLRAKLELVQQQTTNLWHKLGA